MDMTQQVTHNGEHDTVGNTIESMTERKQYNKHSVNGKASGMNKLLVQHTTTLGRKPIVLLLYKEAYQLFILNYSIQTITESLTTPPCCLNIVSSTPFLSNTTFHFRGNFSCLNEVFVNLL